MTDIKALIERTPVESADDLATLDETEILEGYRDGLSGDAEPGNNRSRSYWHGWRNGNSDRAGKCDAHQVKLVRALQAQGGSDG